MISEIERIRKEKLRDLRLELSEVLAFSELSTKTAAEKMDIGYNTLRKFLYHESSVNSETYLKMDKFLVKVKAPSIEKFEM